MAIIKGVSYILFLLVFDLFVVVCLEFFSVWNLGWVMLVNKCVIVKLFSCVVIWYDSVVYV